MKLFQNHKTKILVFFLIFAVSSSVFAQNEKITVRFDQSIESGKLSEIERELFNYVVSNPKDAVGFSLLAKLRLKQNRLNEAKSLANKALSINPNLISAKLTLASALIQTSDLDQSRTVLDTISETELTDNAIRLKVADKYSLIGDCQKALSLAAKFPLQFKNTEALPLRASCYLTANDKKNFALLLPIAKSLAKQNPLILVEFTKVLSKASMHKEVVDLLRSVNFATAKNIDALLLLAKSESFLKDFANAKIHLAQAEKIQPDSTELLLAKSFVESEQGNPKQALDLLEKALVSAPNNTELLANLVVSAMRSNQSGKAFRAAEKLIILEPQKPEFLYLYGASALQNNNLQKAESALTKFLEIRPNDSRGCIALGLTFAAQPEKLDAARQQMQKCLDTNPENYEAAYQLGLSYKTNGETAKAIEYFENTVKLSPDYASALRDLGAVYLQAGEEAKARPVLEKAVSLNPKDPDTHFQISRLYNLIGESALAKKHLEIFQKLKNPKGEGM